MGKLKIKIRNVSSNTLPRYETEGAAGMDLKAHLESPILLEPMERKAIPTGIYIELPKGYEAQIRPRSGLALKKGISCANALGTIDSDYRGEIKVLLINLSKEIFEIQSGKRIAQMVIKKYTQVEWQETKELQESNRGEKGFGSTGM
ncbi:dUTP diphosphatase [Bacteroidetes bacterium endosymbiont of Geopemphigus sp.]|uniref:dUTP diphosphatase n=1 Tax=Bacteroidetes bacterium endosymbiont of Geopemphigus sp. TaxID=2047937 RepID=UPI000CD0B42A|nr:dUTP diphosphatase [Bacteroidetes bacterium endosymbiont of Geopemphigus sp.]